MSRHIVGRISGVTAEPGTLMGPRGLTGEVLVVVAGDETGVDLGYATAGEIEIGYAHARVVGPRSMTERELVRNGGTVRVRA